MLEAHGAVSAQVAVAMAEGVRRRLGDGPRRRRDGRRRARRRHGRRSPWAWCTWRSRVGEAPAEVRRYLWPGDRSENKRSSAGAALELLLARAEAGAPA